MNDPVSSSAQSSAAGQARDPGADFCAVAILDERGRIASANASARQLWQTGDKELIGEAFVSLFVFEIVSTDPEFLEAQWEVVLASALDRVMPLTA